MLTLSLMLHRSGRHVDGAIATAAAAVQFNNEIIKLSHFLAANYSSLRCGFNFNDVDFLWLLCCVSVFE